MPLETSKQAKEAREETPWVLTIKPPAASEEKEPDTFDLELPADIRELVGKLTQRQIRYAVHYALHADRRKALLYAGYGKNSNWYHTLRPEYQCNKPIVVQFMRRLRDYYAELGLWTTIELRRTLQRVIEGDLELNEHQQWALNSLQRVLEKADTAIASMEHGQNNLRVEHVFRTAAVAEKEPSVED